MARSRQTDDAGAGREPIRDLAPRALGRASSPLRHDGEHIERARQRARHVSAHADLALRLPVRAVAARAGVSTRTIKRWICAGLLPATRLPSPAGRGHLRIALADLEALLARGILR